MHKYPRSQAFDNSPPPNTCTNTHTCMNNQQTTSDTHHASTLQARMYFSQYCAHLISCAGMTRRWGHTTTSCTECSQLAGLSSKRLHGKSCSKAPSLCATACTIADLQSKSDHQLVLTIYVIQFTLEHAR